MIRFNPFLWPKPSAVWGYVIAVLSVGAAQIISVTPAFHMQSAPVSLFLCAVIISSWFGGAGPGLLATILCTLAFNYYFVEPLRSLAVKPLEIPRLAVFVVSALFVGLVTAGQRSATESLRGTRDALLGTVQEFQRTNAALQVESRERKYAEEKLRRSEGYLAEAQKLSHTGSWASRPAIGEISYFSEECYRMLGFDPHSGEPAYETFYQGVHPDDQPKLKEAVERSGLENVDFELDYRYVRSGGEIRDIHVIGHPIPIPSSDVVEFVGTVIDITERKRADEALRLAHGELARVNRVNTMGELTASLAHEVNQPIAAAVTNASACVRWLAGDSPNLEKARAAAARIVKDGTHAAEIISRIRRLFKKSPAERELVDVNEVIREMIALLRGEATRYNISVLTDLAADVPDVMGDRVQLQQVMMNLIMNSIDAMNGVDGAREITIKSQRAENEQLQVSISDTGVGLPPQQADQIFNAFFTTKTHGTGMGLRISRSIIESHDGRLWAEDNSPRGASFYLTLPFKVETHE